ncbi:MAG: hypothetical protein AAB967_02660, partial [Patescibacteria group bacterium]
SGYTMRQWYSHSTPEKGPGPGWDMFVANQEFVAKKCGIELKTLSDVLRFKPDDLPDEPYYYWEPVED